MGPDRIYGCFDRQGICLSCPRCSSGPDANILNFSMKETSPFLKRRNLALLSILVVIFISISFLPEPTSAQSCINMPTINVTWQNAVEVSVTGNTIVKTTPNGWTAGASSVQNIRSGYNGYAEFRLDINAIAGLSRGDTGVDLDVDYGIFAGPGFTNSLVIIENGTQLV